MTLGVAASLATGAWLWALFALVLVVAAIVPAVRSSDPNAMVPWPLLALGAVAVLARTFDVMVSMATYLAIAALAIVFVVQLVAFTPIEFSQRFAVVFAVLTTLAIEALWIVVQFYSDVWLGTDLVGSQTALQQDIVLVTVVGFAAGVAFQWFFMRFEPAGSLDRSTRRAEAR